MLAPDSHWLFAVKSEWEGGPLSFRHSLTRLTAVAVLAAAFGLAVPASAACHWWQFGHCNDPQTEGLPDEAPRAGTVITIDVSTNHAYLFQDGELVAKSPAATGSNKMLVIGDDEWLFRTPTGHMKVLRKVTDPVWRKPDWAFAEEGEPIPAPDSPKRYVHGHLGRFALDLGDGILIHGTDDPGSIGRRVSHGCIRLPNAMLKKFYQAAKVGTDVFVYHSQQPEVVQR
jgi:hypothetical protein